MDEIILVDKPAGVSSFLIVSRVRGVLSRVLKGEEASEAGMKGILGRKAEEEKNREVFEVLREIGEKVRVEYLQRGETVPKKVKVGHAGTLDPFATGLLIVLIGKATKRAGEFLKCDKDYVAEIKLGEVSSTGDIEGEIREFGRKVPTKEEVEMVVKSFLGEQEQRVPVYSAVKINGERAYRLARQGKEVEMPMRKIKIDRISVLEYKYPKLTIMCSVSSGTYIRALGEDIGTKLECGGYLTRLRRIRVGDFRLNESRSSEQ